MIKVLLILLTSAQLDGNYASPGTCCPRVCPTPQLRSCCQPCPATCNTTPSRMPAIRTLAIGCTRTQMTWNPPSSCTRIKSYEIKCSGRDGRFSSLPWVFGELTAQTIDNSKFADAPFRVNPGGRVTCKIRSRNEKGWGPFSNENSFDLPRCQAPAPYRPPVRCACHRSCRLTGCGGCCRQGEQFWRSNERSCCRTGACIEGCYRT